MKGLSPGRKVHYVMPKSAIMYPHVEGEHRPMEVVKVHEREKGIISGIVFLNGREDSSMRVRVKADVRNPTTGQTSEQEFDSPVTQIWVTQVFESAGMEPDTWHQPEYVE